MEMKFLGTTGVRYNGHCSNSYELLDRRPDVHSNTHPRRTTAVGCARRIPAARRSTCHRGRHSRGQSLLRKAAEASYGNALQFVAAAGEFLSGGECRAFL